ncbi:hypothetical protein MKQ70_32555 [Chitinophaga sedimenti]|uniref:hypothetical protein n=1 Tax=Chitinophaga sedimenti TaxID=2033606 RepID=UPI00200569CC|nr:hypothetical protein [Chitinophaga sedimenti]MCK7559448.1 hypothetical protein [Chitinophaga sedimenti]
MRRLLKMLPLLMLVLATTTAFATMAINKVWICWGVLYEDSVWFYVDRDVTGENQGETYYCIENPTRVCVICSDVALDANGRIAKVNATILFYGEFIGIADKK